MKITQQNYFQEVQANKLPELLQKSHNFVERATNGGKTWSAGNPAIDNVIKLHLDKVNAWYDLRPAAKQPTAETKPKAQESKFKADQTVYLSPNAHQNLLKVTKADYVAQNQRNSDKKPAPKHKNIAKSAKKVAPKFKLKFKQGDVVYRSDGRSATIVKAITNHPDLAISYAVKTKDGNSSYWYESDISKTKPKTAKPAKKKMETENATRVEKVSDSVAAIRSFVALHGKSANRLKLQMVLKKIQNGILEKRIRKTDPHAIEINEIQTILVNGINKMGKETIEIKIANIDKFRKIGESETRMRIIPLLKRYVAFQSKDVTSDDALELKSKIDKWQGNHEPAESKYKAHAAAAILNLKKFAGGEFNIDQYELNGLAGIGCSCSEPKRKQGGLGSADNSGIFSSLDSVEGTETFTLHGQMGKFLGELEQHELAIAIDGEQGAGKTPFILQIGNAFAELGKKVGFISLEIAKNSKVMTDYVNWNVSPQNRSKIQIAGEAPNGVASLEQYAKAFDVIMVDSWTQLENAKPTDVEYLRKKYPNTIWVFIFQRTVSGEIRGGTKPKFDAPINISLTKPAYDFKQNYAQLTKSRYGNVGAIWNIAGKKVITQSELDEMLDK